MSTPDAIAYARAYLDCVDAGHLTDNREAALCRAIIALTDTTLAALRMVRDG